MTTILFPLLAFLLLGGLGRYLGRIGSAIIAITLIGESFIRGVIQYTPYFSRKAVYIPINEWFDYADLSFFQDSLSSTMSLLIAFITTLVIIYSVSYMWEDQSIIKFLGYLCFFALTMLTMVQSGNLFVFFLGWEGVGLASFLLIGFWSTRGQANKSAVKAVVFNRVGDLGLFGAIGLIIYIFQTADIRMIEEMSFISGVDNPLITAAAFFLFIAAIAKSAQVLLHPWLPDAMEGPTPVSSLLHSATMVTAGIYLILRLNHVFTLSPTMMNVITIFGLSTALLASLVGMSQYDIKKVIAYSTNSQLGFMMFLCGMGLFSICFYHLLLHAFFKCLLFLCSGVVIHALSDEQDFRRMGGLKDFLPFTYGCMLVGSLALIGWPFTAGFYSKDTLFETVFSKNEGLSLTIFSIAMISATLTAFYSTRLVIMTFTGRPNYERRNLLHVQDGDWLVIISLLALAIMSVVGGYGFSEMIPTDIFFRGELSSAGSLTDYHFVSAITKAMPTVAALTGLTIGIYMYSGKWGNALFSKLLNYNMYLVQNKKFLYDANYNKMARIVAGSAFHFFYRNVDAGILEKLGPTGIYDYADMAGTNLSGRITGKIQHFIGLLIIAISTVVITNLMHDYFLHSLSHLHPIL